MAITNDHAWLSTFKGEVSSILFLFFFACAYKPLLVLQDEEIFSDPEQFVEQVLASHDVHIKNRKYFT